jgi:ATP-dependent DNA ligase
MNHIGSLGTADYAPNTGLTKLVFCDASQRVSPDRNTASEVGSMARFADPSTLHRHDQPQAPPAFVPPMLLRSCRVPDGVAWTFEVKRDGRAQLRYDGRSVSLRSRAGRECSDDLQELDGIKEAPGSVG